MKKCGYSFWGYLGDVKYTRDGKEASTPDGNAFYSWCIIRELQKRGYEVTQIMPDRDKKGFELCGDNLFSSWIKSERVKAYAGTKKISWLDDIRIISDDGDKKKCIKDYIMKNIEKNCEELDFILHEYRMLIVGRNDLDSILNVDWQPDYLIQECLFEYCCKTHKRLILFDLDYKLEYRTYCHLKTNGCKVVVFDLGTRWSELTNGMMLYRNEKVDARQVFIPFDFDNINYFDVRGIERENNLVYVGNRYERDWCIDKYIPGTMSRCMIYGNWLEGGRDSKEKWKNLHFGKRLQTKDMRAVYGSSVATILLAKEEYCDFSFMTARIIEAIFYGAVPLFIEEYGESMIKAYAGDYADFLTVRNGMDVYMKVFNLKNTAGGEWVNIIIEYMRDRLKFMDVKYFVDTIEEVIG